MISNQMLIESNHRRTIIYKGYIVIKQFFLFCISIFFYFRQCFLKMTTKKLFKKQCIRDPNDPFSCENTKNKKNTTNKTKNKIQKRVY